MSTSPNTNRPSLSCYWLTNQEERIQNVNAILVYILPCSLKKYLSKGGIDQNSGVDLSGLAEICS